MRAESDEFERMVRRHQRAVFGIALRFLGSREEAEEVAQDVFVALHAALPRLESEEHVQFWLRRTAVHRATDALRRRGSRPELQAELWDEQTHGCCIRSAVSDGIAARLETLVRSLPEPYRTAVVLRYTDDADPEEIAALTGQSVATVKSHLQRGLRMLRSKADIVLKEWSR